MREEIEKKDKELAELTRLILKRQKDLEEEEQKMMDKKRMRMTEREVSKEVTFVENVVGKNEVRSKKKGKASLKNPFRKALSSVRKKLKIGKKV